MIITAAALRRDMIRWARPSTLHPEAGGYHVDYPISRGMNSTPRVSWLLLYEMSSGMFGIFWLFLAALALERAGWIHDIVILCSLCNCRGVNGVIRLYCSGYQKELLVRGTEQRLLASRVSWLGRCDGPGELVTTYGRCQGVRRGAGR